MSARVRCPICNQSNDPGSTRCAYCDRQIDSDADARDLARRATISLEPPKLPSEEAMRIAGLRPDELETELQRGGRLVIYHYCISLLIVTFRRSSDVQLVRAGESAIWRGMPYTLLSLGMGWWGIPFGLIFTPICIFQNLMGGTDVTQQVRGY